VPDPHHGTKPIRRFKSNRAETKRVVDVSDQRLQRRLADRSVFTPMETQAYKLRCTLTFGDIYANVLIWMVVFRWKPGAPGLMGRSKPILPWWALH